MVVEDQFITVEVNEGDQTERQVVYRKTTD